MRKRCLCLTVAPQSRRNKQNHAQKPVVYAVSGSVLCRQGLAARRPPTPNSRQKSCRVTYDRRSSFFYKELVPCRPAGKGQGALFCQNFTHFLGQQLTRKSRGRRTVLIKQISAKLNSVDKSGDCGRRCRLDDFPSTGSSTSCEGSPGLSHSSPFHPLHCAAQPKSGCLAFHRR